MPASTFWGHLKGQSGADEVDQILGERLFAFPKSLEFMTAVLDLALGPDGCVLDATAGSGTTAHAALAMNAADGGRRRFVLVQQAHDSRSDQDARTNICRDITRERVARVIRGYKALSGEVVKGLGGEFAYARLGRRLLDEHRNFAEQPPTYEELAKYVWYTATSAPFDPAKANRKTGRLGVHRGTSYYLLYSSEPEPPGTLDRKWLQGLRDQRAKVVFCERIWMRREDLAEHGAVKGVQIPFRLR